MRTILSAAICGLVILVGPPAWSQTRTPVPPRGALGITMTRTIGNVWVASVAPNSPAESAGLLPGDRITAIDQKSVANYQNVAQMVSAGRPGQQMQIAVERNRLQGVLIATLGSQQEVFAAPTVGRVYESPWIPAERRRGAEWPFGYQKPFSDSWYNND